MQDSPLQSSEGMSSLAHISLTSFTYPVRYMSRQKYPHDWFLVSDFHLQFVLRIFACIKLDESYEDG